MMSLRPTLLLCTLLLAGCSGPTGSLRPRAAGDLQCPEAELSFEELGNCGLQLGTYSCPMRVRGCDQIATYVYRADTDWVRYFMPQEVLSPRAAHDFGCDGAELSFEALAGDCQQMQAEDYSCTLGVKGCGKVATYIHQPGTGWVLDGAIEARGPQSQPTAEPPAPPPAPEGVPRTWLVAVGISGYQHEALKLRFAAGDAQAVHDFFASEQGGAIAEERRVLLTDAQATRAAVLDALTTVAKRTAPEDLLIVYLALHGLPDEGGDLYLIAHDTDPKRLIGTGLAQRDIEYGLTKAGAKRIVLLADACHSGAVGLSQPNKRALVLAETNRLIRQLAETRPGLALLTASSASEYSFEGEKWQHGVFTYHLLEGLRGRADADRNGLVTVRELFDYVYSEVSQATGGEQHPELKGTFDNALPLSQPAIPRQ